MKMDELRLLDSVERYIRGEMNPDERVQFEQLRKSSVEVDQLVVEHTFFLQQMNRLGERKRFRTLLNDIHLHLAEVGQINSARLQGKARVVYLWNRYKRVSAIAASIAVITTLVLTSLVWIISPNSPHTKFEELNKKFSLLEDKTRKQASEIDRIKKKTSSVPQNIPFTTGGTGFMIDTKGYLVTNAHVIEDAKQIAIQNNRGEYLVKVVYQDVERDLAILKVDDENFKSYSNLPYGFSKQAGKLAEPIFTLGYPRNEVVYSQGYLSARTGYNGDTLSCQIEIAANRGNSGSPILNKRGEVIGILNGRQTDAQGFAFAVQSKYILDVIETMKKETEITSVRIPSRSLINGLDRTEQVKRVQDYVYMVKVN
ncbi:MAG: serine protease [Chitinophagaceae bacterium]|nr:serine protease [Chitinophagaceae bacterium]